MTGYRQAVDDFKKQRIQQALEAYRGNRAYAARALGLQRTYLLRLIRDFQIGVAPQRH